MRQSCRNSEVFVCQAFDSKNTYLWVVNLDDLGKWLRRGRQRQAIARVLLKPKTANEIRKAARALNDRIRLSDVWLILRQLMQKKLVYCLNPRCKTGKLYFLTDLGRSAVKVAFGHSINSLPKDVDWHKYGFAKRAKTRRLILLTLAKSRFEKPEEATAGKIRKHICENFHPLGLNPVLRTMKSLIDAGLVVHSGNTVRRGLKTYQLTLPAQRIARELISEINELSNADVNSTVSMNSKNSESVEDNPF